MCIRDSGSAPQVEQDITIYKVVAVLAHPGEPNHKVNITTIFQCCTGSYKGGHIAPTNILIAEGIVQKGSIEYWSGNPIRFSDPPPYYLYISLIR